MELNQISGFTVNYCSERKKVQTLYSTEKTINGNTVMLIIEGSIYFEFAQGKVLGNAKDVVCWNSDELKVTYPASKSGVSYLIVKFDILSSDGEKIFLSSLSVPHLTRMRNTKKIHCVLKNMITQYNSRDLLRKFWCSSQCFELLHLICQSRILVKDHSGSELPAMDYRILKAIDYITVNYKNHITIPKLAKLAFMNVDYFTRLFKKCTGITPAEYINIFKINKAKDFLLFYDEPLAFTATDLGYHDYSHFSRTFRKITGKTPGQFIKQSSIGYKPMQDKWNYSV